MNDDAVSWQTASTASPASRLLSNNLQPTEETRFCGSGPGGVPFVREKAGTSDAYAVAEMLHSRTSPLLSNNL